MTLSFPYERADLRVQAPVTLVLQRLSGGNKNRSARDKRDNNSLTSQAIKASALPKEHFFEIIKNRRKTNTASDLYQFILQHTRLIYLFIYLLQFSIHKGHTMETLMDTAGFEVGHSYNIFFGFPSTRRLV